MGRPGGAAPKRGPRRLDIAASRLRAACRGAAAVAVAALLACIAPVGARAAELQTPGAAVDPVHAARAISLAPHITELVFAAGAGSRIVATVSSSDYPPAAAGIPRIGDGLNINLERALTLDPDLVIAWQSSGAVSTLAPSLTKLHVPIIYSHPRALRDIPAQIRRFGRIFDTQATARPAAAALQQRIDALQAKYAHARPVTVFIEVGASPLYTIGGDPLLNNVLEVCGGVNLYAGSAIAAPQIDVETLMLRQPDVIIVTEPSPARYRQRVQAWTRLRLDAALKGHVYNLDPDQLFRPGPRLVDAAEHLCADLERARPKSQ